MKIKTKILVYTGFILTIFFGFFLNENSSGGGKVDHDYLFPFIINFSKNFFTGLEYFLNDKGSLIHSPVFYILTGYFIKVFDNILLTKIIYILVCCLLPLIFYKILKLNFKINNKFIYLFSLLIFLSPYFRSSAIWLLGDNLSLIFFSLSILFYLKTKNSTKISNYFACLFFLILCCYIRYYYFLFSFFYLFYFSKKLDFDKLVGLIIFCLLLSLPSIIYFYYVIIYFNFFELISSKGTINFYSNSLIILSIIFTYIIPFVVIQFKDLIKFIETNKNLLSFILIIFLLLFFLDEKVISYNDENIYGGGVFIKLSKILNISEKYVIYPVSFLSFTSLIFLFEKKFLFNFSIIFILILSFPLMIIFQKYFDPLVIILLFGLIKSNQLEKIFLKGNNNLFFIFLYFFSFFIISTIYYL